MNHSPGQADHEWPPPAGPSQSSLQREEIESVGSDMDIEGKIHVPTVESIVLIRTF